MPAGVVYVACAMRRISVTSPRCSPSAIPVGLHGVTGRVTGCSRAAVARGNSA